MTVISAHLMKSQWAELCLKTVKFDSQGESINKRLIESTPKLWNFTVIFNCSESLAEKTWCRHTLFCKWANNSDFKYSYSHESTTWSACVIRSECDPIIDSTNCDDNKKVLKLSCCLVRVKWHLNNSCMKLEPPADNRRITYEKCLLFYEICKHL